MTRISIAVIWIYVLVIQLTPTAICTNFFTTRIMPKGNLKAYSEAWQAFYHATVTVPIILIVILYIVLMYILEDNSVNESKKAAEQKKSLAKMTMAVTIGTLIAYTPFIIWTQYLMIMIKNNNAIEVSNTTASVS